MSASNRDASIVLDWADDTYKFRLGWGELEKLQEECDAGPYEILHRLHAQTWRVRDISNVIRFGLIGGGLDPIKALKLVKFYVHQRPPVENLLFAQAILSAGCIGAPEEGEFSKKVKAPDQTELTTSQTGNSGSEPSTEQGLG